MKCFGCKYSLLVMLAYPLIMNKTAHCQRSHQPDVAEPSKMRVRVLRERAGERERELRALPQSQTQVITFLKFSLLLSLSLSLSLFLNHQLFLFLLSEPQRLVLIERFLLNFDRQTLNRCGRRLRRLKGLKRHPDIDLGPNWSRKPPPRRRHRH